MAKQEKPHPYPPGLPSSFCYLPWVQFGTTVGGFPRLCANTPSLRDESGERLQVSCSLGVDEVWNGEQMKAIRRQMISGQLPEICRRCSDMESSGLESKRLKMIHLKPEWAGDPKDLLRETGEDGHLQAGPRSFNLRLGNVCNLKCVMCRPDFSSKWQGDFTRLFTEGLAIPPSAAEHLGFPGEGKQGDHRWYEESRVFEFLKSSLPSTKQFYFSGGEPMMTKLHGDLIDHCLETGHCRHIHLMYDTNGLFINEDWLRKWERFETVDIHLSVDGVGPKYEYIRYPGKWEQLNQVARLLSQWQAPGATVRILVTQQLLNALDGDEILSWYLDVFGSDADVRYQIVWNLVEWPECLTSHLAAPSIKEKAWHKMEELVRSIKVNWPEEAGEFKNSAQAFFFFFFQRSWHYAFEKKQEINEGLREFVQYLNALDQIRGTDWQSTFPELAALIQAEL